MRSSFMAVVVVAVLLSCAASSIARAQGATSDAAKLSDKIALLPVIGSGVPVDALTRDERAVRKAVETALPTLQKESITRQRLDSALSRGLDCDRGASVQGPLDCFVEAGVVLDSENVVTATLERSANGRRITLAVVDVRSALVIRTIVKSGAAPAVYASAAALLAGGDARGIIQVEGAPSGAVVLVDGVAGVDGVDAAAQGGPSPLRVRAGAHHVVVQAPGFVERTSDVVVESGGTALVDGKLDAVATASAPAAAATAPAVASPVRVSPSTIALGVGGATAALGVAAVVVGLVPRIGYAMDAAALADEDAALRGEPTSAFDEQRANDASDRAASANAALANWTSWGEPLAVTGGALLGAGMGVLVAALLFPGEVTSEAAAQ